MVLFHSFVISHCDLERQGRKALAGHTLCAARDLVSVSRCHTVAVANILHPCVLAPASGCEQLCVCVFVCAVRYKRKALKGGME